MYRKARDGGAAAPGERVKPKPKPKVALKRTGTAGANGNSSTSSTSSAASSETGNAARKRPTKLRAPRERRARDRSMDDDEDLEHKFSNLSVAAPAFVPGKPFVSSATSPGAAAAGGTKATAPPPPPLLNGRSLAFVTERSNSSSNTKAKGSVVPSAAPPSLLRSLGVSEPSERPTSAIGRPNVERRPRRQRIGAMGFSKAPGGGVQGRVTRQSTAGGTSTGTGAAATRSLSIKTRLTDDAAAADAAANTSGGSAFQQRARSDSAGSDSDYGSDDEVYPEEQSSAGGASSAFPDRLTLFSQQKHIPKKARRDVAIDTVFDALFAQRESDPRARRGGLSSAFGDDTGTDNDEPNAEFVKRGLAASLFKDDLHVRLFSQRANETQQEAVDRFLTPALVHALVTDLRFEDFRTASARLDILRAVHRNFARKRLHVARALADATQLRLQYVTALVARAHALSIEKSAAIVDHRTDHGHGFTELLRYAIEHVGESVHGFGRDALEDDDDDGNGGGGPVVREMVRNYMASLLALWRAHWLDPAGSDDEELISCAGQFVSYLPSATPALLRRLLAHWPRQYPAQEVIAIRMVARVVMSSPPLHTLDASGALATRLFARLAASVQSPHTQVAQEALAFTGCQFALVHFLGRYDAVYKRVTEAFHANVVGHWHEGVRATSESHFDRALDYAP